MGVGNISHIVVSKFLAALIVGTILAAGFFGVISAVNAYSVGSDDADWWIEYPDQHSDSGSEVEHPEWVLEELEEGPIIVLIHSSGCPACIKQEADIEKVLNDVGDNIIYNDLLMESDYKAYQTADIYEPTGEAKNSSRYYVPVTVLMTLVPDSNGSVEVGWHSYTGYGGESLIRSYVDDAIDLYEDNSDGWKR